MWEAYRTDVASVVLKRKLHSVWGQSRGRPVLQKAKGTRFLCVNRGTNIVKDCQKLGFVRISYINIHTKKEAVGALPVRSDRHFFPMASVSRWQLDSLVAHLERWHSLVTSDPVLVSRRFTPFSIRLKSWNKNPIPASNGKNLSVHGTSVAKIKCGYRYMQGRRGWKVCYEKGERTEADWECHAALARPRSAWHYGCSLGNHCNDSFCLSLCDIILFFCLLFMLHVDRWY